MHEKPISTLEMSIIDVNSEFLGVSRHLLMENAGRGIADLAWKICQETNRSEIIIFAGKGGNGGDGMVAARHLAWHLPITVYLMGSSHAINKGSTKTNWKILCQMTNTVRTVEIKDSTDVTKIKTHPKALIIDALLGTGIRGEMKNPILSILEKINSWKKKGAFVISIDTPTGVDPNTGQLSNIFLTPQRTFCLHRPKKGLSTENSGRIDVISIGVPPEAEEIVGPGDLLALKTRQSWSKKGDHGKILVIGGNETYSGAPTLAAMAAIRAGTDLVTILTPDNISAAIRSYSPELIVQPLSTPHLAKESITLDLISQNDVVLLGPGLGTHPDTAEAVKSILDMVKSQKKPIVIDADALKLIDTKLLSEQTILTPHSGEFERLTGKKLPTGRNQFENRKQLVYQATSSSPNIWVVKGHWDIVADTNYLKVNKTGTPLMTRGGTGDVLAGIIAGLIPQTASLFYAACIGVYLNGRAGELSIQNFSLPQLLQHIPLAIQEGLDFIRKE
ncbi:MAG: NAD(P)H-hydrate dehydratase [Candidatus Heimdallarchaeota archaeon]